MRCAAGLVICGIARVASAEPQTSPIRTSDYAIELYDGVAYGNAAVVGMGGATIGLAIGTAGTLFNPSAPAVRPTTDNDRWSWDYHLDGIAGSSTDYDNNGFTTSSAGNAVATAGLGGRYGAWGVAVTGTGQIRPIVTPQTGDDDLRASAYRFQIALARWFDRIDTAIGASLTIGTFSLEDGCAGEECSRELFAVSGGGIEAGATWVPRRQDIRVGAAVRGPFGGGAFTGCDPSNCAGWILPESIASAWRLATGVAYRFGPTAWNQQVPTHFRDERAVTLTGDVIVTGPVADAYGLESFGNMLLQRSGRHTSVSVRGGVEYEWKPGRLRLRGGSYWEPSRFVGVPGRLHVTLGFELRVFEIRVWGKPRRGRISITSDVAERYANGGLSIGFWH